MPLAAAQSDAPSTPRERALRLAACCRHSVHGSGLANHLVYCGQAASAKAFVAVYFGFQRSTHRQHEQRQQQNQQLQQQQQQQQRASGAGAGAGAAGTATAAKHTMVLLTPVAPSEEQWEMLEAAAGPSASLLFVVGRAASTEDLRRAGATAARRVIVSSRY